MNFAEPGLTKILATIAVVLVVLILLFAIRKSISSAQQSQAKGRETYLGLRNLMLTGSRARFSLPPASSPTEPWGVLMDWGVDNGMTTVVAIADGGASIYLSSGGGFLGGIGQEPIRNAAKKAVGAAARVQPKMDKTETFPLPETGHVRFYVLTDAGVYTTAAAVQDLRRGNSPFFDLGNSMQGVITECRVFQEKHPAPQS